MNPLFPPSSPKSTLPRSMESANPRSMPPSPVPPCHHRLLLLRKRTLITVSLALTAFLGVIYSVSSTFLTSSIQAAEEQNTQQTVENVLNLLGQTYEDFAEQFYDKSAWDDTYEFIQTRDPAYIQSNLSAATLARMKVDVVLYFNTSGEQIYGAGVDIATQRNIVLPPALLTVLGPESQLLRSLDRPEPNTGIVMLPDGPMLLTAQPILTSRSKGPIRGTVIFGRYLDLEKLQKMTNHTQLLVHRKEDPRITSDILQVAPTLAQQRIQVELLNEKLVSGYACIPDLLKKPALLLRMDIPREGYRQAKTNLGYFVLVLLVIGGVFWLITLMLINRQAELFHQIQRFSDDLEVQVQDRTSKLEQALGFEGLLNRITEKVRDSLDETYILQTVVQEIAQGLRIEGCDTSLYDLEHQTSTIVSEYRPKSPPLEGSVVQMADFPELYPPLLEGHVIHCCVLYAKALRPLPYPMTILACPIVDNRGVLGDLWLYNRSFTVFSDAEVRLLQQVTNQCAIAIRQARLYQSAQVQVQQLERLNSLKDDFLSTVSHELRTPMASIKMAIQMLEISLKSLIAEGGGDSAERSSTDRGVRSATAKPQLPLQVASQNPRVNKYLQILHNECDREIGLINDLLDLSRLEAGGETFASSDIDPREWLGLLLEPFVERTRRQQQQLEVQLPDSLPTMSTDVTKLERILTELLQNACKYTPAGERIRLAVEVDEQLLEPGAFLRSGAGYGMPSSDPNLAHGTGQQMPLLLPRSIVRFMVGNSGVELPPYELAHIFDKFYRVAGNDPWKHGGTGLGLALVKKLVTYLGGTIFVRNVEQEMLFTVELPIQAMVMEPRSSLI